MAFGLCKYKNAFGVPGEGIHSYRLGKGIIGKNGIAVMDILVVLIFAAIISYMSKRPFWLVSLILFALGIVAHRLFCVRSTVDVLLFPEK